MKKTFLVILTLLSVGIVYSLNAVAASPATNSGTMESLDQLANQSLELTKLARYTDAKMVLNLLGEQFEEAVESNTSPHLTSEEIQVLRLEQKEAMAVLSGEEIHLDTAVAAMLRFRLAMDAVATDSTSLWLQMKASLLATTNEIEIAIQEQEQEKFEASVNQLLRQYQTIYPAMKLDTDALKWQKIDDQITYLDKYRTQVFLEADGKQTVMDLQSSFTQLFEQVELGQNEPSLIWVIVTTTGIILGTLSYVGWRKYYAERITELPKVG